MVSSMRLIFGAVLASVVSAVLSDNAKVEFQTYRIRIRGPDDKYVQDDGKDDDNDVIAIGDDRLCSVHKDLDEYLEELQNKNQKACIVQCPEEFRRNYEYEQKIVKLLQANGVVIAGDIDGFACGWYNCFTVLIKSDQLVRHGTITKEYADTILKGR